MKPRGVRPKRIPKLCGSEIPGKFAEVARHGRFVVEVTRCNLDDLVAVVTQPGSDALILLRCGGIAVQMPAQSIEVDTDALVLGMMRSAIDDVGRRRPDRPVEADLLSPDSLLETGREEQVPQPPFLLIDWMRAFRRRL